MPLRRSERLTAAELPDEAMVLDAARIEATCPLAGAPAAAAAVRHDATLRTGDPELLVPHAPSSWRDLRR